MQIIIFSSDNRLVDEWIKKYNLKNTLLCYDINSFIEISKTIDEYILACDYDTISHDLNEIIASNLTPRNCIVLEKVPAIATGKMLISKGIKAYGNSRMQNIHFKQLVKTVIDGDVWTYPELTSSLITSIKDNKLSNEAQEIINSRLTKQEINVTLDILNGLTNEAISNKLNITTRTVKAHVTSIFKKLHVNDRISLVLLLK